MNMEHVVVPGNEKMLKNKQIKSHHDGEYLEGHWSQVKELRVSKQEQIRQKINKGVLDYGPKYNIHIYGSLLI